MMGHRGAGLALGVPLLGLILLPPLALLLASSPDALRAGVAHPAFAEAVWLSLRTSAVSLAVILGFGTPLAWFLAGPPTRLRRTLLAVIDLPIVLPPAVMGIALLAAFGRAGLLGGALDAAGLRIAFSTLAVVVAQVVIAAPFYVQSAVSAFQRIDEELMLVARTLGATPRRAFFSIALPLARGGLVSGAALALARALGEFGATLLFAGNLVGRTQTMPLAVYSALEGDLDAAIALALVLGLVAVLLLAVLRAAPRWFGP